MRRVAAIALLLVLTLPAWSSLLARDGASLPACCRRDGRHHCAIADSASSTREGHTVSDASCPYRDGARLWAAHPYSALRSALRLTALLPSGAAAPHRAALLQRASLSSRDPRGPPSASLS